MSEKSESSAVINGRFVLERHRARVLYRVLPVAAAGDAKRCRGGFLVSGAIKKVATVGPRPTGQTKGSDQGVRPRGQTKGVRPRNQTKWSRPGGQTQGSDQGVRLKGQTQGSDPSVRLKGQTQKSDSRVQRVRSRPRGQTKGSDQGTRPRGQTKRSEFLLVTHARLPDQGSEFLLVTYARLPDQRVRVLACHSCSLTCLLKKGLFPKGSEVRLPSRALTR